MQHKHIDPVQLRKELHYDPETGVFTRLRDSPTSRVFAGFRHVANNWDVYVRIRVGDTNYAAHRLAWVYMTGEQPDVIDHINGLRHDNRWANLRNGTRSDNMKNMKCHRLAAGTYIPQPD